MKTRKYILNKTGNLMPVHDDIAWAIAFENTNRTVGHTTIGSVRISTVFLGLDHNYTDGEPILWETMVFGGPHDQEMDRCSGSREQAEAMHARMVKKIKEQI